MNLRSIFRVILFALIFISCSEEEGELVYESSRIAIQFDASSDRNVVIVWNKPRFDYLEEYVIVRTIQERENDFYKGIIDSYILNGYCNNQSEDIFITEVPILEGESFIDLPGFESEYYYRVFAYNKLGDYTLSNTLLYEQDNFIKLNFSVNEAIYSPVNNKILFKNTTNDTLYVYSCLDEEIITKKSFYSTIGFLGIGSYQSVQEIYVPRSDGNLTILDFGLSERSSVFVGNNLTSVCTDNNGNIFVYDYDLGDNTIYSINRSDLTIQSGYGSPNYYNDAKLSCLSENVVIEQGYSAVYSYSYDQSGVFNYFYDYLYVYTDYDISEVFPDGSKMIIGQRGYIIDNTLSSYSALGNNYSNNYNDFAINSNLIFASNDNYTRVDVFNYGYSKVNEIDCAVYPKYLCVSSTTLYIIGTPNNDSYSDYIIEKVPLTSLK